MKIHGISLKRRGMNIYIPGGGMCPRKVNFIARVPRETCGGKIIRY